MKGKIPWNKGLTKETDARVAAVGQTLKGRVSPMKGKKRSEEFCKKCSEGHKRLVSWNKGRRMSIETREKLRKANKGKPSNRKDYKHTSAVREKISKAMEGKVPWNKGKKMREEAKEKIRKTVKKYYAEHPEVRKHALKRANEALKEKRKNSDFREKWLKAVLKGLMKRPTSYEQKIIDLCSEFGLPVKYVGDGEFWLTGCGKHINPDFIVTNGQKKVIEVYHNYWKSFNYKEERSGLFKEADYGTLFLNDEDLDTSDWKDRCLDKIIKFVFE